MIERKKPETAKELEEDIANHPERGMFTADDGRLIPAVRTKPVEIRGDATAEAYEVLLEIWGAKGLDKAGGLKDMISYYITDIGNLKLVEHKERIKSQVFNIEPREVRNKVKGYYKARGRELKSRLEKSKPAST